MDNINNIIINKLSENNCKVIKILLVISIIILLILLYNLRKHYQKKNNIFLTTDNYKQFKILEENWSIIRDEIPEFDINQIKISREQGVWMGDTMDKFAEKFNNKLEWFKAWSNTDSWYNFPLMYKNKIPGNAEELCPNTCKILKSFNNIRIAGFSLLVPNGDIQSHTDTTGPNFNSMALNMPLVGKKSSLYVRPHDHKNFYKYTHTNGKAVIFNAEQEHFADNKDNSYRIILYLDFGTN